MWLAIIICKKYTKDKISVLVRRTIKGKKGANTGKWCMKKTHGLENRRFISLPSTPQPLPPALQAKKTLVNRIDHC